MIKTLIVDDEKIVRKGLISTMPWENYGFSIAGEAANGEKALEFIKQNEIDLVFIDLTMPVMSGLELMHRIYTEFPGIFMAVLTCHQDFGYIQEALRHGAIDYIVKTQLERDTMESVLERISRRINQERSATQLEKTAPDNEISPVIDINPDIRFKYSDEIIKSILDAVKYISENLKDAISQDVVAKRVNMSRGYFSQCFKDITGKPFGEFVRQAKISRAKELLSQTNKPVYWVADQLGFLDEKYFSRFFREHTGILPSEYRFQSRS